MNTKDGWVQGYNAQAIVNPHQIVLACEVSQDTGDVELYQPMNNKLAQTLTAAGITNEVELVLADAGYCSEANSHQPRPRLADRHLSKTTNSAAPPASSDRPPDRHHPTRPPSKRWNTYYAHPKAPPPTNNAPN